MVDAKLVALTAVLVTMVYAGVTYLETADSANTVETTDDFALKLQYMCDRYDGDGCASTLCALLERGDVTTHTPLNVACGTYNVSGSLDAMGTASDWYTRATLVNSEEPAHATEEWCAAQRNQTQPAESRRIVDDTMGDCSPFLPIIAAAVNAEYERYVARDHLETFGEALDAFCANTTDPELQFGCDEARAGFKAPDSVFQRHCTNGELATFVFGEFLEALDAIRLSNGGQPEILALLESRCAADRHRRLDAPLWHTPALTTSQAKAGTDATAKAQDLRAGARATTLKGLLRDAAPPTAVRDEAHGRNLHFWHHHHSPHGHSPHDYVPGAGCRNKCSNACFGRCGPGCTRWSACGCDGRHAHQACWEHDHACSCGKWWYPSCLALGATSLMNAPGWLHGENTGNSGCSGSNWLFHQSVQGWGSVFKGWRDPAKACSKAGDWNYDQLGNWMGMG